LSRVGSAPGEASAHHDQVSQTIRRRLRDPRRRDVLPDAFKLRGSMNALTVLRALSRCMTFSVEDHGIVWASPPSAQVFIYPQEILINFDHLAAIRSTLNLAPGKTGRQRASHHHREEPEGPGEDGCPARHLKKLVRFSDGRTRTGHPRLPRGKEMLKMEP